MPLTPSLIVKVVLCGTLFTCMSDLAYGDLTPDLKTFDDQVKPLLKKYCVRCHGDKKVEAETRLDTIDPDVGSGKHFDEWEDVREAFNTGEMPPEGKLQPSAAERNTITRWLDAEFKKAKQLGNGNKKGSVRRLTRYELRYALEDLLNFSAQEQVEALPEEGTSVETGLKNSSRLLMISSPHLESYLNVILSVISEMKEIAAFEPYSESVDIANLDVDPKPVFVADGKRRKPLVGKIERDGIGVVVNPGGYIDLAIPSISKYLFETSIDAKSGGSGRVEISIGFQHSDVDTRQKLQSLGSIDLEKSEELRRYSLSSYPENLPTEMTRALDRPFFIRLTNRGKAKVYLKAFDYQGNISTELTSTLIPADIPQADIDRHVRQSLHSFIERAFRRSPTDTELKRYYDIFQGHAKREDSIAALLSTYKEILCSPSFFYLGLPGDLSDEQKENYKLAERMAFFLWCSVPDKNLLKAASDGELTTPSVLASQVERMLADEKSKRWVETFADQWLQTSKLYNVAVDRNYYPKFRDTMKKLMHRETIESVADVFRKGSSALNLLKADHVFVNQTLAGFYQIKGVRGSEFTKVPVGGKGNRGGLLTQGTFLVGNSDGMNSHAILRGVWLAEVILNDAPPSPPQNVPPLDESIPGFDKMTLNEKLFAHRDNAACRNCHQNIDPWGLPFENYDASGAWRDQALVVSQTPNQPKKRKKPVFEKNFVPIDREATFPDGVTVDGIEEFKDYLVTDRKHDFAKGLTERILAYALSRDIDFHDEDLVNNLVVSFEQNGYTVPILIREIVQSEQFQRGY